MPESAITDPSTDWFGENSPTANAAPASNLIYSGQTHANTAGLGRTGTPSGRPTGIPDPNNPGYDTAGWLMGSKVNPDGTISVPNPSSGQTATTNPTTNATTSAPTPPDTAVDKYPTAASLSAIYGAMPTIPTVPAFGAPTAQQVLDQDPGFAFRESQGEDALRYAASAGGLANSTGTLQDLIKFNQNFASGEYQNAFDRALGVYNTNLQTQYELPYAAAWQQYLQGVNNFNTNQAQAQSAGNA